MAVIRVNKTRDYTVISNSHLRDKNLSLKAKGLLTQMLTLPDDWNYSIEGLAAINAENVSAINSAIKELQKQGYIIVTKLYPSQTRSGRIEYVYDIYEQKQEGEKQGIEIQGVEFQGVENRGLYKYTENKDTDYKNIDVRESRARFHKPTLEEVEDYIREENYSVNAERFINYYDSNGWRVGKNPMKDWKAAVRTWNNKEKPKVSFSEPKKNSFNDYEQRTYDFDDLEMKLFNKLHGKEGTE